MDRTPGPEPAKSIFFIILVFCLVWPVWGAENSTLTSQSSMETPLLTPAFPAGSPPVTMTVNTARKIQLIQGIGPEQGLWLIIDLSLENTGFEHGYAFSKKNFVLVDQQNGLNSTPTYRHIHLSDPFTEGGIIPLNTTERGEIAFNTNVSPNTYLLVLSDTNGKTLSQSEIQSMQINDYDPSFAYTEIPPGQLSTLVPRGYGWSGGHDDTPIIPSVVPTGRAIPVTTDLPVTIALPATTNFSVTVEPAAAESSGREPDLPLGMVAAVLAGVCTIGAGILAFRSYMAGRHSPATGKKEEIFDLPRLPPDSAEVQPAGSEAGHSDPAEEIHRPSADATPVPADPVQDAGGPPEDAAGVTALQEEADGVRKTASALRFYGSLVMARLSSADEALRAGDTGTSHRILSECSAFINQLREYESRIDAWRSAGYITTPLETITTGDPQEIADEFRTFGDNILRLEMLNDLIRELKRTYPALVSEQRFDKKLRSLDAGLNDPVRTDSTESDFRRLKAELEQEQEQWEIRAAAEKQELKVRAAELLAKAELFGEVPKPVKVTVLSEDSAALGAAVRELESFESTAKPVLEAVPETLNFTAGTWHKTSIRITNTGSAHAFDVRLSFSEEVETRRLKPARIMAKGTAMLEIGLLPKIEGTIPLEIAVTCQDLRGNEYRSVHEFWIEVTGRPAIHGTAGKENVPAADRRIPPIDVFISYSHEDKNVSDAICNALESEKVRCWIAPRDILPGMKFQESIIDAIDASSIMVIIFSSHSNISPHVISEVTEAMSKGVIIIPFRIEDVLPSKAMKYLIGASHWLDAMTPPIEQHIGKLIQTVRVLLETQDE
jgi:hypothetical protein